MLMFIRKTFQQHWISTLNASSKHFIAIILSVFYARHYSVCQYIIGFRIRSVKLRNTGRHAIRTQGLVNSRWLQGVEEINESQDKCCSAIPVVKRERENCWNMARRGGEIRRDNTRGEIMRAESNIGF
jgi:hypothetical protein